ncbi:hypothetical protein B0T24DRAFT_368467 [Lasiosphaeria ovina]|uniref:Uncharacterized protein n=1 Tax=Lasiosphaeria ovina TaxID=92902 RepID=A0AAE0N1J0_9PEZI|nr:hypothetical protein B0T24DRAFT_368467 [Lasiosphaeria ovina]
MTMTNSLGTLTQLFAAPLSAPNSPRASQNDTSPHTLLHPSNKRRTHPGKAGHFVSEVRPRAAIGQLPTAGPGTVHGVGPWPGALARSLQDTGTSCLTARLSLPFPVLCRALPCLLGPTPRSQVPPHLPAPIGRPGQVPHLPSTVPTRPELQILAKILNPPSESGTSRVLPLPFSGRESRPDLQRGARDAGGVDQEPVKASGVAIRGRSS